MQITVLGEAHVAKGHQLNRIDEFIQRTASLFAFLKVPLAVVLMFGILAVVTYNIDSALSRDLVKQHWALEFLEELFGDRDSTRSVLATLSSALITVTSITFSLLLLAVQQGASSLSSQIMDQFLKRKANQLYFGFFVGLSLFTLITLATTHRVHHPLFGALFAIAGTVVALCLILVLIYTTVQQMRSTDVIGAIVEMIRSAHKRHSAILGQTRGEASDPPALRFNWKSDAAGIVIGVDIDVLAAAAGESKLFAAEIHLKVANGSYVARGQEIAEVRSHLPIDEAGREKLEKALRSSFTFGTHPNPSDNPRIGMHQLATIGWNSASSARSNPRPPIIICRSIADLLWEWTEKPATRDESSRVVYPDLLIEDSIETIDSIVVAAGEAKQHQTLAVAYETYARLLPRLGGGHRARLEEAVRLSLGALQQHVPTVQLNKALEQLARAFEEIDSPLSRKIDAIRERELQSGEFAQTSVARS